MFVCVCVCQSVCSLLRYRLNVFLTPLPEVGCPIFVRDLESLGKSNGKKWSQIVKLLLIKGLHLPRKKSSFFGELCSLRINLYFVSWSSITYHLSPVTCHLSPVTCHLSPVTCHPSPVNCHLPPAICNPSSDHN